MSPPHKTTKYPFTHCGSVLFNVAGEHGAKESNSKRSILVSNSFKINYISDIPEKNTLLDMIFHKKPSTILHLKEPKTLLFDKPDLGNSLIWSTISSIILTPMIGLSYIATQGVFTPIHLVTPIIIIFPLLTIYTIWAVKVRSYYIQDSRVVGQYGIIYKKQKSILYSKINHINYSQGILNKLFNNGNVQIVTTGSAMPELSIDNVNSFSQIYEMLKKHY